MKIKLMSLFGILLFSHMALSQGSAMSAAPGQPPPPEGWTRQADPNGGIHMPKKKKKYKLRLGPGAQPTVTATPVATPKAKPANP